MREDAARVLQALVELRRELSSMAEAQGPERLLLRAAFLLHVDERGRSSGDEPVLGRSDERMDLRRVGERLIDLERRYFDDDQLARISVTARDRVLHGLILRGARQNAERALDIEQLGSLYESLLAGDERRRTGSHYTPRSLTEPIVRTTLRPLLEALGPSPTQAQILALKVCDPAMGSGAFLLEACRQLAAVLVLARDRQTTDPLHARRLVAERCLYGVDKNPIAVELARLSLWLLTQASDVPLRFLDHGLKCGDSLIDEAPEPGFRRFCWQREFPDVFVGDDPGFSVFLANPPFLGGRRISASLGVEYRVWLDRSYQGGSGNADLSAFFLRRMFDLTRQGGCIGMLATNTIAQGDTREGGLAHVVRRGGVIYSATRRIAWPGKATVVVSALHVRKGASYPAQLDGCPVPRISAYLLAGSNDETPKSLAENVGFAFQGVILVGLGFVFEDGNPQATPISTMQAILRARPSASEIVRPYIGGEELNTDPRHRPHRYVIHFGERSLSEARAWPELLAILEEKVRPERATRSTELARAPWWQFWRPRKHLFATIAALPERRMLAIARVTSHVAFAFLPTDVVPSEQLTILAFDDHASFCVLQSRVHELWARLLGSTLGDGLRYSPTDCFETFPMPQGWRANPALESMGRAYHGFRADLMDVRGEGLTKIYNRFHDPDEDDRGILELRELHGRMDHAVLEAYGWGDLAERLGYEFQREHEESGKKQPWRYRLDRSLHDEVLARLLELADWIAPRLE